MLGVWFDLLIALYIPLLPFAVQLKVWRAKKGNDPPYPLYSDWMARLENI